MSCFIIEQSTFEALSEHFPTDLVKQWAETNIRAYMVRYAHHEDIEETADLIPIWKKSIDDYKPTKKGLNKYQLAKILYCVHYNSDEFPADEQMKQPGFKTLDKLFNGTKHLRQGPEYKKAEFSTVNGSHLTEENPLGDEILKAIGWTPPEKGFHVYVYSNGSFGEPEFKEVTLIGPGVPKMYEPTEDRPAVKLVKRNLRWGDYLHAEPIEKPAGMNGPMMGGCFIYSTDSRFRDLAIYPVPLHDRFENP